MSDEPISLTASLEASPSSTPPAPPSSSVDLLEPGAIHARRRPRMVFFVWAFELAFALLVATPVHAWARRVWGAHPDGDAILFRPGGRALLTWLGEGDAALPVIVRETFILFLVFALAGQVLLGALATSLATSQRDEPTRPPRLVFALSVGLTSFLPLSATAIAASIVQAVLLVLGGLASGALDHAVTPSYGDARGFVVRVIVFVPFAVVALLGGVVADMARVAIARDIAAGDAARSSLGWLRVGLRAALGGGRRALAKGFLAWGWRAALALLLVLLGGWAGDLVGGRGSGALAALFAFHQLLLLVRVALRASWLAAALRLVR